MQHQLGPLFGSEREFLDWDIHQHLSIMGNLLVQRGVAIPPPATKKSSEMDTEPQTNVKENSQNESKPTKVNTPHETTAPTKKDVKPDAKASPVSSSHQNISIQGLNINHYLSLKHKRHHQLH